MILHIALFLSGEEILINGIPFSVKLIHRQSMKKYSRSMVAAEKAKLPVNSNLAIYIDTINLEMILIIGSFLY
tara:strand:+ start:9709 stop:9927 length:219 start_codon:yes stop_codon:yes gene_type:complete